MKSRQLFAEEAEYYDQWYERHYDLFLAEVGVIEKLMPEHQQGIEIGIGTGRFSAHLGIGYGIDPVPEMLQIAAKRGIKVQQGYAECLPYADESFDYALMTTTICFLDDIDKAFSETSRILRQDGIFTVAFIDKNSYLGRKYRQQKRSRFYTDANFYTTDEIIDRLEYSGFETTAIYQTLFDRKCDPFEIIPGNGAGAFVGINGKAKK